MLAFITKSFPGHLRSKNDRNFSPAASIYWLIKINHKIPVIKILENCLSSDVSLYYQIVSRPSKEQKSSKFFACGGHLLAHKTTSSALKSQFRKTASDVIFHYQIASGTICVQNFSIFSPAAKNAKNFFWAT